ncbi:MAG: hypothetical protein ACRDTJ_02560 [Pseudonocardiaceae bacterium]
MAFLTELAQTIDPAKNIHLILDNGSSHTSKQTRTWLKDCDAPGAALAG